MGDHVRARRHARRRAFDL